MLLLSFSLLFVRSFSFLLLKGEWHAVDHKPTFTYKRAFTMEELSFLQASHCRAKGKEREREREKKKQRDTERKERCFRPLLVKLGCKAAGQKATRDKNPSSEYPMTSQAVTLIHLLSLPLPAYAPEFYFQGDLLSDAVGLKSGSGSGKKERKTRRKVSQAGQASRQAGRRARVAARQVK